VRKLRKNAVVDPVKEQFLQEFVETEATSDLTEREKFAAAFAKLKEDTAQVWLGDPKPGETQAQRFARLEAEWSEDELTKAGRSVDDYILDALKEEYPSIVAWKQMERERALAEAKQKEQALAEAKRGEQSDAVERQRRVEQTYREHGMMAVILILGVLVVVFFIMWCAGQ
jgi:hypothetical protein